MRKKLNHRLEHKIFTITLNVNGQNMPFNRQKIDSGKIKKTQGRQLKHLRHKVEIKSLKNTYAMQTVTRRKLV